MAKESIDQFRPQVRNANKHSQRGMGALEASMRKHGYVVPMTAAADGEIIDGSARLETSVNVFGEDVMIVEHDGTRPIIMVRTDIPTADTPEARAISIAANRIAELNLDYDVEILMADMQAGVDMTGLFSEGELASLMVGVLEDEAQDAGADTEAQTDKAEELNKVWQVKLGELWAIGDHRLKCGDSAEKSTLEHLLRSEKVDLLFTDPPYGVAIGAKNRMLNSFQKAGKNLTDIEDDALSPEDLKAVLLPAFRNAKSHMNDCCSVFMTAPQGGDLGMMMMMMMEAGLPIRHVLIWKKNAPTFSMGRLDYDYQHEPILFTWNKTHKRPMLGAHRTSVWEIDKPRASPDHPTMKPVELVENALLNNSDPGDIVLDLYTGSGTTMIACHNLKRAARCVELSPNYCAVILQRMADHTGLVPERIT